MELTKSCTKCLVSKDLSDFYRSSGRGLHGRMSRCKMCSLAMSKAYFKTEAGKMAKKRLDAKYSATKKGKLSHAKACRKYTKTESGKEVTRASNASEDTKRRKREYVRSAKGKRTMADYLRTPHGRDIVRKANRLSVVEGRASAYLAVRYAIKAGKLIKHLRCSECSRAGPTQMHHPNGYLGDARLGVVELCKPCHDLAHRP